MSSHIYKSSLEELPIHKSLTETKKELTEQKKEYIYISTSPVQYCSFSAWARDKKWNNISQSVSRVTAVAGSTAPTDGEKTKRRQRRQTRVKGSFGGPAFLHQTLRLEHTWLLSSAPHRSDSFLLHNNLPEGEPVCGRQRLALQQMFHKDFCTVCNTLILTWLWKQRGRRAAGHVIILNLIPGASTNSSKQIIKQFVKMLCLDSSCDVWRANTGMFIYVWIYIHSSFFLRRSSPLSNSWELPE